MMKMPFLRFNALFGLMMIAFNALGHQLECGLLYQKKEQHPHVLHVVTLNQHHFKSHLVKAKPGQGRLPVKEVAERVKDALVAVNGGFFEIGGLKDGNPTGTLIIDNQLYRLNPKKHAVLMQQNDKLSILKITPSSKIKLTPNIPQSIQTNDVVWGNQKVHNQPLSMVRGIPMLLIEGKINPEWKNYQSNFYQKRHARTAIGLKEDGTIVILVAEHHANPNSPQGLNIEELAKAMKSLDCIEAINLDGGSSSSLWVKGKLVNSLPLGQLPRAVSDVIVFSHR